MASMWRDDVPMTTNPYRFFFFASKPHWKAAAVAIALASVADVLSSSVSYVFKYIANAAAGLPSETAYQELLGASFLSVAILGLAKLFWRLSGFSGAVWAMGAMSTARYSLTSYVTLHSRSYFSDRFAGSLANKISHAARGMREMVDQLLWNFLELFVTVVASFTIIFLANPLVSWIFLVWVFIVVGCNTYLVRKRNPLTIHSHQLETALNGATVDLLSNISAMQEYARRLFEIERLRSATETRRKAGLRNWYFGEWIRIANSVLLVVFGGAMTFTTVYLARTGLVSLGDVILVITVIFRIEGQLQSLGSNLNLAAEVWGEVQESLEEIVLPHELPDRVGAGSLAVTNGAIDFNGVTFSYAGNTVFKDLNLHIPAGQRMGLVGRSGAGKSTFVRLLMHHHSLEAGSIAIDGIDIETVMQESLRDAISIVPQEPLLFHRTIRENIAYGNPRASEEEIIQAAKLAQAHDFIERLPSGYEALVGERGIKLSGGERQRIAIARAILKNAPILILDEATSSLDSESEIEIQSALRELMRGKTVIAIAHRLSTLREMDRIIVFDQGEISEEGTHDELVESGGIYSELWQHQAGGFIRNQ